MAAWIAAGERGEGPELLALPLGIDGAPLGQPHVLATVPREATSLIVRSTGASDGGWLIAWTALLDRGESLSLLALAHDGTVRGTPQEVRRTGDHLAWADLVMTPAGALCLWAEETNAGEASLLTASIRSDGKPRGVPARVVRGVVRWAAVRAGDGAALALVTRSGSARVGLLSWMRLDAEGRAEGAAEPIGKEPTVGSDVDVVPSQNGWVLAWTDPTGEDAQVMLAAVDGGGVVQGPVHAIGAVGGSSLVALASGPAGVALAWESPHGLTRPRHWLHLAAVSTAGGLTAQPIASLQVAGRAPTELTPTSDGFALLTTPVPQCSAPVERSGNCPTVPMFLRYDAQLSALQAEPLFLGKERTPSALGWGLACLPERCLALAGTHDTPTAVFAVDLTRRESPYPAPMRPSAPSNDPRATSLITLVSGALYTDIGVATTPRTTLLATLASVGDAKGKRAQEGYATVVVHAFDGDDRPIGTASTLTSRALSLGRIAVASGRPTEAEAAVAWVARDEGDPQVHVARVDGRGHRTREVQLTSVKGDASDVALAWVGDGWMVAWIDGRDGNGEVYSAKVDPDLKRLSPDQRVTRAPGDATDVTMAWNGAASGGLVWIAWSDPRESPRDGLGDIYVTTLRARDAKRVGDEERVLATAAHSRSPQLASDGRTAWVGWIEDAPPGVDAAGAAMTAEVDETGHVVKTPSVVHLADEGRPTSIALAASGPSFGNAQMVVARSAHDGVTLDAVTGGGTSSVVDLEAAAPFEVAVALAGGAIFYVDAGSTPAERRVRRLAIAWPWRPR
jgi:hypothetical protein